jgi:DnaJ-class molecular chaperone
MFFDHPFAPSTFLQDMLNEYISRRQHRTSRRTRRKKAAASDEEAGRIFGVDKEEIRSMSRAELISRYRKLAQKLHPDKGGNHEEFIRLTEVYKVLLRRKRT